MKEAETEDEESDPIEPPNLPGVPLSKLTASIFVKTRNEMEWKSLSVEKQTNKIDQLVDVLMPVVTNQITGRQSIVALRVGDMMQLQIRTPTKAGKKKKDGRFNKNELLIIGKSLVSRGPGLKIQSEPFTSKDSPPG